MPTTISSYYTFIAGTKARSAQVNTNFSNYRGTILPINENTATASHETHDLGSEEHRWHEVHLAHRPVVSGSTMMSGETIQNNYANFVYSATTDNYYPKAINTSAANGYNLKFDDLKIKLGNDRVLSSDIVLNKELELVQGYTAGLESFDHFSLIDQYGDTRKDITISYPNMLLKKVYNNYYKFYSYNQGGGGYMNITGQYSGINLLAPYYNSSIGTIYLNGAAYSVNAEYIGFVGYDNGISYFYHHALQQNFFQGLTSCTTKFASIPVRFGNIGADIIYNNTVGTYATGIVTLKGQKYTLTGSDSVAWSCASYTGSKGNRTCRYIYESSGVAVTALTCTSVLEAATLAFSGAINTNTGSIVQNDGKYLDYTMVRITDSSTTTKNMFNIIVSGASASGTSWVFRSTFSASGFTTTTSFVEHYAYVWTATDHSRETIASTYDPCTYGEIALEQYDPSIYRSPVDLRLTTATTEAYSYVSYIPHNGASCFNVPLAQAYYDSSLEKRFLRFGTTGNPRLIHTDFMTGCDIDVYNSGATSSVSIYLDGCLIKNNITIAANEFKRIKVMSDAPIGTHNVTIESTLPTTAAYLCIGNVYSYLPKRPSCSSEDYIIHEEHARMSEYRQLPPATNNGASAILATYDTINQGVWRQFLNNYSKVSKNVTTPAIRNSIAPGNLYFNLTGTGEYIELGFWGQGFVVPFAKDTTTASGGALVSINKNGGGYQYLTASSALSFTTDYWGTVNPFRTNYYQVRSDTGSTGFQNAFVIKDLPLDYYSIKVANGTSATDFPLACVDVITPCYDFRSHHLFGVGGRNIYNRLQYKPNDEPKKYEIPIQNNFLGQIKGPDLTVTAYIIDSVGSALYYPTNTSINVFGKKGDSYKIGFNDTQFSIVHTGNTQGEKTYLTIYENANTIATFRIFFNETLGAGATNYSVFNGGSYNKTIYFDEDGIRTFTCRMTKTTITDTIAVYYYSNLTDLFTGKLQLSADRV